MNFKRIFWLGFFLTAAPFLFCFVSGYTFAPMDALRSTSLPYAALEPASPPDNHFWSDTLNFYLPRLYALSRHEFPISFSSGGGGPLYADTISGFFSPFSLLVFGALPVFGNSLDLLWMLQFLVFYAGIFLWLKSMGIPAVGAFLGAITQVYCTAYFPGSYFAFQSLGAMAFLPWALWADEVGSRRVKAWAPALFLSLCIYSGNIQTMVYPILIYGAWAIFSGRILSSIYSVSLAVLFAAPMLLTGIEYHVILGIQNLAERKSQVPEGWGKLTALLAIPGIFFPELYGSSKSIDFLKGLKISVTYFIGSIGFLGPLLGFASFKGQESRTRLKYFSAALILGSVLVMVSPLLDFLYYRILCVLCFGLSCLVAATWSNFPADVFRRLRLFLPIFALALVCGLVFVYFAKIGFSDQLKEFFSAKLMASKYSWWPALNQARVDRWFLDYLSSGRFLVLPALCIGAWFALKRKNLGILAGLVVMDIALVWFGQVTFNQVVPVAHPALTKLDAELRKSPSYPASRFLAKQCVNRTDKFQPDLFGFVLNEYVGAPSVIYYGSTNVERLAEPQEVICDSNKNTLSILDTKILRESAINLVISREEISFLNSDYRSVVSADGYTFWLRKEPFPAIWPVEGPGGISSVTTAAWSGSSISWKVGVVGERVDKWRLSLPYYPGWRYKLDGREIFPDSIAHSIPQFKESLTVGVHDVIADFYPRMLLIGLAGCLASILIALWKSISIRD